MAWQRERAAARIERFKETVPQGDIVVQDFVRFLADTRMAKVSTLAHDSSSASVLVKIPRNRAIMTNAVHVYANLVDFNSVLVDAGRETEASHRRAFEFLHTHYSACDTLIDEFEMQRVDFHGPRLHAVVLAPDGDSNEAERVRVAIAFAAAFREMVERIGHEYPEFRTDVRIGIDTGPAVAIDGGKADEAEPLFIGSPANHAAKLAAGDVGGVYPSERARRLLQQPDPSDFRPLEKAFERAFLDQRVIVSHDTTASGRLQAAYDSFQTDLRLRKSAGSAAVAFTFHYKTPPLSDIVFADHPPSNAVRMPSASLFADIDGFTAYIDGAIRSGAVAEAVANLHIMRAEMAAVLRDDFKGRKVRFVGDCIHGLLAEGNAREVYQTETMRTAVLAASGIRSSFELCQTMLPGIAELGIAIGIDFGTTPICRLGLRGAASVRAATSRATCLSEAEQQRCTGLETALGQSAYSASPATIRQAFMADRKLRNLTAETAAILFGTMSSPYINTGHDDVAHVPAQSIDHAQPKPQPMRAHCRA